MNFICEKRTPPTQRDNLLHQLIRKPVTLMLVSQNNQNLDNIICVLQTRIRRELQQNVPVRDQTN